MFNIVKKEIEWNGKTLSLEVGKVARQASGSVMLRYGNTTILAAVTVAQKAVEGADFLPLTVNYIEKSYAAGKIPGGFFKREAKPSEVATLTSRLIDRPIRPLFPGDFHNEINVTCTLLSYDSTCNPDIASLIAASAALSISEAPFSEAVAGARVGLIDDQLVLNTSNEDLIKSDLDLVVAGTESSVLMVESEAKQLSEEKMLEAVNFAHESFQSVIKLINELKQEVGKEKITYQSYDNSSLIEDIRNFAGKRIVDSYKIKDKQQRVSGLDAVYSDI
jgi:polyribonucleotide nucleotidyltransferase